MTAAVGVDGDVGVQTFLVASSAAITAGAAFFLGTKKDPEPCDDCSGTGGAKCIFCEGGRTSTANELTPEQMRDEKALGLTPTSPYECRVCRGAGLILCKTCNGKGLV